MKRTFDKPISALNTGDLREYIIRIVDTLHQTKSHRDRQVPITPQVTRVLYNYMVRWRRNLPGEHLFCYRQGAPMDVDRLRKILVAKADELHWPAFAIKGKYSISPSLSCRLPGSG